MHSRCWQLAFLELQLLIKYIKIMDVKELRIGNLIQKRSGDIKKCDLSLMLNIQRQPVFYKPMSLNEEWLLNFGFEKDIDDSFVKNDLSIFLDMRFKENVFIQTTDTGMLKSSSWHKLNNLKIKYVHQLQNLYLSLTGEELKLKLES